MKKESAELKKAEKTYSKYEKRLKEAASLISDNEEAIESYVKD
jgi:hypothetical protein